MKNIPFFLKLAYFLFFLGCKNESRIHREISINPFDYQEIILLESSLIDNSTIERSGNHYLLIIPFGKDTTMVTEYSSWLLPIRQFWEFSGNMEDVIKNINTISDNHHYSLFPYEISFNELKNGTDFLVHNNYQNIYYVIQLNTCGTGKFTHDTEVIYSGFSLPDFEMN